MIKRVKSQQKNYEILGLVYAQFGRHSELRYN